MSSSFTSDKFSIQTLLRITTTTGEGESPSSSSSSFQIQQQQQQQQQSATPTDETDNTHQQLIEKKVSFTPSNDKDSKTIHCTVDEALMCAPADTFVDNDNKFYSRITKAPKSTNNNNNNSSKASTTTSTTSVSSKKSSFNSNYTVPQMAHEGRNLCILNYNCYPTATSLNKNNNSKSSSSSDPTTSTPQQESLTPPARSTTPQQNGNNNNNSIAGDHPNHNSHHLLSHAVCESLLNLRKTIMSNNSNHVSMILMSMIEIVSFSSSASSSQQQPERIFDLLHPVNSQHVYEATEKKLKHSGQDGSATVDNVAWREVPNSIDDFDQLLKHLPAVPSTTGGKGNNNSIRSSCSVLQFLFQRREPGRIYKSTISVASVPFPSSSSTSSNDNNSGESSINLKKCLDQITSSSSSSVSSSLYRQSILTHLLSDLFTGNCALSVVASVPAAAPNNSDAITSSSTTITQSILKFLNSIRNSNSPSSLFVAKSNSERAAAAVNEMKNEVEELRKKLEEEKKAREEELHERADEVAELETRRKRLEQEQRAKKALNAKALASISKQMKTLQQLQSQMTQKQKILKESTAMKLEKQTISDQQSQLEQKRQRETEMAQMREQEAILQRQIALQLEAQQSVQQKMREETEKSRADLLSREMSFVLRAAAHRTRDEAQTALLRTEVQDLKKQVENTRHEVICKRLRSSALTRHCREQQNQLEFLQQRHLVMDTLLNDGVESRAKDLRDAKKDLEVAKTKIANMIKLKKEAEQEIFERTNRIYQADAKSNQDEDDELARLRAIRDEKRSSLNELSRLHDELLVQRSVAEDAAGKACRDAENTAQQVREAELMNARRRQEESIYGEQLADVLRTNVATTDRIHELDSLLASIKVTIKELHEKRSTLDQSRETFSSFLENQQHALALVEQQRRKDEENDHDDQHHQDHQQDETERQNNLREQLEFQRTHSMLKSIKKKQQLQNSATTHSKDDDDLDSLTNFLGNTTTTTITNTAIHSSSSPPHSEDNNNNRSESHAKVRTTTETTTSSSLLFPIPRIPNNIPSFNEALKATSHQSNNNNKHNAGATRAKTPRGAPLHKFSRTSTPAATSTRAAATEGSERATRRIAMALH